jgi:hypothetical protein
MSAVCIPPVRQPLWFTKHVQKTAGTNAGGIISIERQASYRLAALT